MMLRIGIVLVLGCLFLYEMADGETESDFVCQENVTYVLDDHYPCECPLEWNNTLTCDLSKCSVKPHVKKPCNVGLTWKRDCNRCWCRIIGIVCSNTNCTAG